VACLEENTLFEFLCGGLPVGARDAVAEHAAVCEVCRRMIAAAAMAAPAPVDDAGPLLVVDAGSAPVNAGAARVAGAVRTSIIVGGVAPPIRAAAALSLDPGRLPLRRPSSATHGRLEHLVAGKYRLLRLLGAGGMGTVHEAVNTWTGRHVAVKQLRPALSSDAMAAKRFMREARSASRIAHPNVVDILDLGRDPETGALYMVQELLAGETLRRRIAERGALSVDEVVRIMAPALSALAVAHAAGVVHRDLKPDNIFLATNPHGGEVTKLIDFGLSKRLRGGGDLAITAGGRRLGTPFYMAPEQLRGDPELDERIDVWSAGVVLFEAVAGARPFPGPGCVDLIRQVVQHPARPLAEVAPGVSPAFAALVARALDRDRNRRPHAAELHAALAALARPLHPAPAAAGPRRRSPRSAGMATPARRASTAPPSGSRSRRSRWRPSS
jgi:serine/threonine protein kinase